jgi:hypothetical protein
MSDIGLYDYKIVHDWIMQGETTMHTCWTTSVLMGWPQHDLHPVYWVNIVQVIVVGHCGIREVKATRRWVQHATWHTPVAMNGGWITIAREPEKMWMVGKCRISFNSREFGYKLKLV